VIVECPHCDSKVDCEEKGRFVIRKDGSPEPVHTYMLECRVCHQALFGWTEMIRTETKTEWGEFIRLWPAHDTDIPLEIPEIARQSLVEARLCFKAKAFSACAVMCGRTIEGVCKHHNPEIKNLAQGLRQLLDGDVIDNRLYEWGDALRIHRNLGAHATEEKVSREDAKDLLDFSLAICDYIFILNVKFERFQERQKKCLTTASTGRPTSPSAR
jgi:uncharacterized protein DUF4145